MTIFNGVMGLSLIYAIWGQTYFFSYYALYDNPQDLKAMRDSFFFTLIPGAFFTVPVMFFGLGFTSTFSLLHNKAEGDGMTLGEGIRFIIRRFIRLLPYTLFIVAYAMCMAPSSASGPFWENYKKAITPCTDGLWWTNILFVNNLYPANFDDKCLPWNWFLSCYMQFSILLPLIIGLSQILSRTLTTIFFTVIAVGLTFMNALLVANSETGIFLRFDDGIQFNLDFYAQHFMKPYFHFSSYLWGIAICMNYLNFVRERVN